MTSRGETARSVAGGRWIARAHGVWAFVSYAAVTALLCRAVLGDLARVLPSDPGDPVLNTWILWWNAHTLPLTERWWNAPAFYPSMGVLAFSEHLLGIAPISTPIIWVSGNPVVAYNIAFLLSFPLSGVAAYLLALEITGRRDAAWLAGLVYAFAPYRIAQLAHLQVLSSYWAPLALLGLHRYLRDPRARWLALFAGAYVMQGLANGYFLLFLSVLVGLWVIWFVPLTDWRRLLRIAVAWGLAAGCLLPVILAYRRIHDYYGFERSIEEIIDYSADLLALVRPSPHLDLWGWLPRPLNAEVALFPGLVAPLVVLFGLGCSSWRVDGTEPRWRVRARWILAMLAAMLVLGALAGTVLGPWSVELGGVRLSIDDLEKPVSEALLLLLILALTSPLVLAARRRRSAFAFYVIGLFLLWFLSLGPFPRADGVRVLSHAPYDWLMALPGFSSLRVPARLWMFAVLCLSAAASLAIARTVPPASRIRFAVVGLLGLGVVSDTWVSHLPTAPVPARSLALEATAAGPVLELPLGWRDADLAAMFRSMYHHQPVLNGMSGYGSPSYAALAHGLNTFDPDMLRRLASLGVRHVLIDRRADPEGVCVTYVKQYHGVHKVGQDGELELYELPERFERAPFLEVEDFGQPLAIAGVTASVNVDMLVNLFDGDRWTRWHSGPQQPGHELQIDLGAVHAVGAVAMDLGAHYFDFPRELQIDVSGDGVEWTRFWAGRTVRAAFDGALSDPRRMPLVFPVGTSARYLRFRQMGEDPVYYWSIAELAVLAPR